MNTSEIIENGQNTPEVEAGNTNGNETVEVTQTTSVEYSKSELVWEISDLVLNHDYTRFPEAASYKGEGKSIYEWATEKFGKITKQEVKDWFKNIEQLRAVKAKRKSGKRARKVVFTD